MTAAAEPAHGPRLARWLRAMRLQFYPMTWLAYSLGAVAAAGGAALQSSIYWLGFAVLVLLEMATVFTNELVDYDSDRRNAHAGPFNGGSRVLVEGAISARALRRGAVIVIGGALLLAGVTMALAPSGSALAAGAVVAVFGAMALGYTLPPPMLAYRGAAEFTVAATHSTGPVLLGHLLQGGALLAPAPWLLSVPLLLGILPAITLAAIPDSEADRAVGKRTLAVRRGSQRAALAAQVQAGLALAAALAVSLLLGPVYGSWGLALVALHATGLAVLLQRYRRTGAPVTRIDGLLVTALTFLFWFVLLPLLVLAR